MKEQIYTIPLNEAFDKDSECPFCELQKKLEADVLDYILGPAYMEEDIREETDKAGFCKRHYEKMFAAGNRLGAALMVSTHLQKINNDLKAVIDEEMSAEKRGLFKKSDAAPAADYVEELSGKCYACAREQGRMNSYVYTFFYLWKTEQEFRDKVKSCKGFCLEHFARIAADSRKHLNAAARRELMETVTALQKENMERIAEELSWFIKKFDYRFKDEPWKDSKDSLERAIQKISGTAVNV